MATKGSEKMIRCIVWICIVVGAINIEIASLKVFATGINWFVLWDNTKFDTYQSEEYKETQKCLSELYNSEDCIERVYCRLPAFLKSVIWIFSLILAVLVIYAIWLYAKIQAHQLKLLRRLTLKIFRLENDRDILRRQLYGEDDES